MHNRINFRNSTGPGIGGYLITGILLAGLLLIGCSKDLFYLPGASIQEELDKAIESGFDGMIVYVNQSGTSAFYSAGFDNREQQLPADPHVLFKIASISKLYMAAATCKLVANQALSLESTLAQLIPEVAGSIENADQITLKMLLGHRSGIPEYIYHPDFDSGTTDSYLETAALIFDQPADFAPDQSYAYTNTNFLLIGEILDRTLGYSHHTFIRQEILLPLGLNNTYSLFHEVDSNAVMNGYLKGYDPSIRSWDHTRPGGSMIATAEEVGLFLRALIDGTLLNAQEQAIYTSVYPYEHTGWLPGYTSIARYHSDIDAVVIQFVNTSGTGFFWIELERVYSRLVKILETES
ncbi:MAG: beta-lactamase family protein [Phaeodactylibacter sp.]|nr:beta-lactamase family protein [Phaeodactylibacter sp.]